MKGTAIKLAAVMGLMVLSVLFLRFTHNDFFFLTFVVAFIFSILYWIDLGQHLRDLENPSLWKRVLGFAFGVPQAILGLTSILIGVAMIGWVLYNSLIEKTPEYSGGFLSFGIALMLVSAGSIWLVLAFKWTRGTPSETVEED